MNLISFVLLILLVSYFFVIAYVELEVLDGGGCGGGPGSSGSSKKGRVLRNFVALVERSQIFSVHKSVGYSGGLKICRTVCFTHPQHGQILLSDNPTRFLNSLREWK